MPCRNSSENYPQSCRHGWKALHPWATVTVGTILGLLACGQSRERILQAYPYLEPEDIDAVVVYAAWRLEEREEASPLLGLR